MPDYSMINSSSNKAQARNRHELVKKIGYVVVGLVIICFLYALGMYVWHWEHRLPILEVHTLKVDSGIATFIRTPQNNTALIDPGMTNIILSELTNLTPFYRHTIDCIILTSLDDSRITSLPSILSRYKVGKVIVPAFAVSTSTSYIAMRESLDKEHVPIIEATTSEQFALDASTTATVLFPPADFHFSKTNKAVLALKVEYVNTNIYLTNGLSKTEQKYITSTPGLSALVSSSTVSGSTLLIFQQALNTNTVAEEFFSRMAPSVVVVSKKPQNTKNGAQSAGRMPIERHTNNDMSTSTEKALHKLHKVAKPPFSVTSYASTTDILNIFESGDAEFDSTGERWLRK